VTPNELDLTFWVPLPNYGAKFHQNRVRIATVREVTDRHTDASAQCPCYETDNKRSLFNIGLQCGTLFV